MVAVLLWLVKLPDGGLLSSGVPLVLAFLLPAVKARLVLPLIRRAPQHQGLLLPDTAAGEVEPCGSKRLAKIQPLSVGVEYINGGIIRHDLLHIRKGIEEKIEKLLRCHVVIFDFPGAALVVHVVGRVGDDKIRLAAVHEGSEGFFFGAVTADEPMPSQYPDVSRLREGRLLQFGIHVEIIIFSFNAIVKQLRQLLFVKAGEKRIKIYRLQGLDLHTQKLFIPACVHRHTVVGNDVGFFLRFGEVVSKDARHLIDAFLLGGKNTTMTGNHAIVTVDNHGIDEAKLTERGAELVNLLRAVCPGVIDIRHQLCDRDELHFGCCFHQASPHSANFSKPSSVLSTVLS